jgi:hypothetical protein
MESSRDKEHRSDVLNTVLWWDSLAPFLTIPLKRVTSAYLTELDLFLSFEECLTEDLFYFYSRCWFVDKVFCWYRLCAYELRDTRQHVTYDERWLYPADGIPASRRYLF